MAGVFVTAIGTDCGKTHVSAAILRELTARQRPALALKPLMSGYSPDALEASDAGRLLIALGRPVTRQAIDDICWKSFTEWLAPNVAARRAGVVLDYEVMLKFVRDRLAQHAGASLVEGAGGREVAAASAISAAPNRRRPTPTRRSCPGSRCAPWPAGPSWRRPRPRPCAGWRGRRRWRPAPGGDRPAP